MAGIDCSSGSRARRGFVPAETVGAIERLETAVAVILARTTVPEFCYFGITESAQFGRTSNPWDTSRTAGGSSGGAAAALATGCGPLFARRRRRQVDPDPGRILRDRRLQGHVRTGPARTVVSGLEDGRVFHRAVGRLADAGVQIGADAPCLGTSVRVWSAMAHPPSQPAGSANGSVERVSPTGQLEPTDSTRMGRPG